VNLVNLSWRDRIQLVNSVLSCVAGIALIARYFRGPAPLMVVILGLLFLGFGVYRLALARREIQKRVGSGT
jgi:uncharacterized membrane protein HdeD (DUF308 family)